MLRLFDIIRRVESGTELMSALRILPNIETYIDDCELASPYSGCFCPCKRCWLYKPKNNSDLCQVCDAIVTNKDGLHDTIAHMVMVWGYSTYPCWDHSAGIILPDKCVGYYLPDPQHFLILTKKDSIRSWLKRIALEYGDGFKGLVQIIPTMGKGENLCMGDIIARVMHQETVKMHDRFWIRFFPQAWQVLEAKKLDEKGCLTYTLQGFLDLMDGAGIFHNTISKSNRDIMYELLAQSPHDISFHWGRFVRSLDQRTRDLLDAWQVKSWGIERLETIYQLHNYVYTRKSN